MSVVEQLDQRIANNEVLLIDGGMGSELEARGVPMDHEAWCGLANVEQRDVVRQIHEDYIRAGADVILTNTYPTNRAALEAAGAGDRVREINRSAVEIALEARERAADGPTAVAGSMSIWGFYNPDDPPALDPVKMLEIYREQASILAEAGVDLIVLEMFASFWPEGLQAASETGLPVWLGVWADLAPDGTPTAFLPDRPLEEELPDLLGPGVTAVTLMHSTLESIVPALEVVARLWNGPRGAYPHVGEFERPRWVFHDIAPDDFATEAQRWVDQGAQLAGGCCGIGPQHIAAVRERLLD